MVNLSNPVEREGYLGSIAGDIGEVIPRSPAAGVTLDALTDLVNARREAGAGAPADHVAMALARFDTDPHADGIRLE